MKCIKLLFLCSLFAAKAFCQTSANGLYATNSVFDGYDFVDTTHATPAQMHRIHAIQKAKLLSKDHYYYDFPYVKNIGVKFNGEEGSKTEIYEGERWGPDNQYKSILIDGNCGVAFSALEVTEKNAADYRYRVTINGKETTPWTKPTMFATTNDQKLKFALLYAVGTILDGVLKIEVYNIHDPNSMDAMLIDWRPVEQPQVVAAIGYTSRQFRIPDNGVTYRPLSDTMQTTETGIKITNGKPVYIKRPYTDFIETRAPQKDIRFHLGDSLKNIHFWINNDHELLYPFKVTLKRDIGGHIDNISLGETNKKFDLYKQFWQEPGNYTITFTPRLHKHGGEPIFLLHSKATSINFTVLPALNEARTITLKTAAYIILILLTTGGFMFFMYRNRQKRRLAKEAQNRQIATLQLQSVRAQLNPHFIFNALSGIQNLMNKNAIEDANKYLSRFARITRNVLDDGQKELVSVEQETSLLTDYLQMEQLRFGFSFEINIDEAIDQQTEIPVMLLQPFVENAVKHGISTLKENGAVNIGFTLSGNDLILSVKDNGKGFSGNKETGMGIKLCEERIRLLNDLYKPSVIILQINSDTQGTLITIKLANWI